MVFSAASADLCASAFHLTLCLGGTAREQAASAGARLEISTLRRRDPPRPQRTIVPALECFRLRPTGALGLSAASNEFFTAS